MVKKSILRENIDLKPEHTAMQSIGHMMLVSIVVAVLWACVRGAIIKFNLFPTLANDYLNLWAPFFLGFLAALRCLRYISELYINTQELVVSFLYIFFTTFLIGFTGNYAQSKFSTYFYVQSLERVPSADTLQKMFTSHYLIVDDVNADTSECTSHTCVRSVDHYQRLPFNDYTTVYVTVYETCPLKSLGTIFVGSAAKSQCDFDFPSLKERQSEWVKDERMRLLHTIDGKLSGRLVLKRLTARDGSLKYYVKAAKKTVPLWFFQSALVYIYEIQSELSDVDKALFKLFQIPVFGGLISFFLISIVVGSFVTQIVENNETIRKSKRKGLFITRILIVALFVAISLYYSFDGNINLPH